MTHGIDLKLHRRIPKELARQTVGLPKDILLFTSYNRNQPRKRLDIVIMAFVELITRYPTKPIFMLMIADKGDRGGYPLFDIFSRELKNKKVSVEMYGNRLLLTNKETCYTDEDMNMFNNIGDVGINCAEGEGFGLCAFDQMSVGVPQIVPNINGYNEYCTEANSLLVEPKWRSYIPHGYNVISGEAQIVDYMDIANAMDKYVCDEELRKIHAKKAQESIAKYTWEESVKPLIKRLQSITKEDE
jgi:glycosyltransferase involved in cell wall biosynthesis